MKKKNKMFLIMKQIDNEYDYHLNNENNFFFPKFNMMLKNDDPIY